ncbi:MAG: HD domain-containing protein, partial [Campylobacteraceae bacterium]|nr:HD domain-containing protein [Campylobacteraceae bacterium]
RYENSAEHSWHVSLLVMTFAEDAPCSLDVLKVLKMILLHDIVEIDAGDTIAFDIQAREAAFEKEKEAAKRIFGLLPAHLEGEFTDIWMEFEESTSKEAKFAKAMDAAIPVLQNINNNGQSWIENGISLEQVLSNKRKVIEKEHPLLWKYIEEKLNKATYWTK